jgi:hypothetical protein
VGHSAIEVTYKCDICGKTFIRIYELTGSGKNAEDGFYEKVSRVQEGRVQEQAA